MYSSILVSSENKIVTIELNRPEVGNAFSVESYQEICEEIHRCEQDPDVGAIIITGNGKLFCAGGDIKSFREILDQGQGIEEAGVAAAGKMTRAVRLSSKPVISAINGAAAGAGAALALASDFRVMGENSCFVTAFIGMGFSGDSGLIYYLQKAIGTPRTTYYLMTSDKIDSKTAYELGICNMIVPDEEIMVGAKKLAKKLVHSPAFALARQKKLINEFFYSDLEKFNQQEAVYMRQCSLTQDHEEAVNAFLEKRKPEFKGC